MKRQILKSSKSKPVSSQAQLDGADSASKSQGQPDTGEAMSCKNGVCLVTWKPIRPQAA